MYIYSHVHCNFVDASIKVWQALPSAACPYSYMYMHFNKGGCFEHCRNTCTYIIVEVAKKIIQH